MGKAAHVAHTLLSGEVGSPLLEQVVNAALGTELHFDSLLSGIPPCHIGSGVAVTPAAGELLTWLDVIPPKRLKIRVESTDDAILFVVLKGDIPSYGH